MRETLLFAGTIGQGVWRSRDLGDTFERCGSGLFMEADVRALAQPPEAPATLYAGTDAGLYRTDNLGDNWVRVEAPFDTGAGWSAGEAVWSLLAPPGDPGTLFVGTCPPSLYRSRDAGATWTRLSPAFTPECPPIVYSRVTCLRAGSPGSRSLWVGVEVDGAWLSDDFGDTWRRADHGISSGDIHDIAILPGRPETLLAATNNDLNISLDGGATWQPQQVAEQFPFRYCRGLAAKPDDPMTVYLGNGNGPPGSAGAVLISRDGGVSWRQASLPDSPNSTIWTFAVQPEQPDLVVCASVLGYLYRSEDAGRNWVRCRHEFGEVRALALAAV